MIDISKNFEIKTYGRFADELLAKEYFKDRMFELSRLFKEMGESYLKHLGDDAKISGAEKKDLIDYLEKLVLILVMLRKIDFLPDVNEVNLQKDNGLYSVNLRFLDNSIWELVGRMLPDYKMKQRLFKDWFNDELSEDIKTFFAIYGNASLDKEISERERTQIARQVDHLILEIVEMIVYIDRFMLFQ
ncbi:hypothetical protein P3G55_11835 [Leptospira sp. 96542]|nr:hypothetical protein [Leptospira sp. 96542]